MISKHPGISRLLIGGVAAAALAVTAACTEAQSTKLDERTFRIEGPGVPGGSDVPNQREADRLCKGRGYRVLDTEFHRNGPDAYRKDAGDFTNWTIRCL